MKIEKFNTSNLKQIRVEIQSKLDELKSQFGIDVKLGNISYTLDTFKSSISCTIIPEGMNKYQVDFNKYCTMFNLKESDYNRLFLSNGKTFKLIGLKPSSPKFCVLGESIEGQVFKFPSVVLSRLK